MMGISSASLGLKGSEIMNKQKKDQGIVWNIFFF